MIIIGSRAISFWYPDFREAKDWDIIARPSEILAWATEAKDSIVDMVSPHDKKVRFKLKDGSRLEFETITPLSSNETLETQINALPYSFKMDIPFGEANVPSPSILTLIKRSHLDWNVHWRKNIEDYHWLKDRSEGEPSFSELYFYQFRHAENVEKFGVRRINTNMSNEAFFAKSNNSVGRMLDHDDLHDAMKYGGRPLFETFKNDLSKASLDKTLFDAASLDVQQKLAREEIMVIALERFILPGRERNPSEAYSKALQRLTTVMTTGWFRDFLIENWSQINKPDVDYIRKFQLWMAL
jgi:hypothetical protein